MSTRSLETDTAVGLQRIHKHQPCLLLTNEVGVTLRAIILSPGPKESKLRYVEIVEGRQVVRERQVSNQKLIPVKITGEGTENDAEARSKELYSRKQREKIASEKQVAEEYRKKTLAELEAKRVARKKLEA